VPSPVDDRQKAMIVLARQAAVGIANAKATGTPDEVRLMIDGYLDDSERIGALPSEAWGKLASVSLWWISELVRSLAAERGEPIEDEFTRMGLIAAGMGSSS